MKQQLFTTDDAVSAACAVNTKHRGRLLAMAAGILSVLILLVTAMQFVISAGADRYSEYSNSCRKYMMAFMKNDSTYSQLVNATRLPYRNYVESLQRDQGFLNSLTAWKAANLDLSGGVSEITQSAEYKYYLGILMDLMTDTVNETNLLDAADAYMDALHISLAKQSVNTLKKYNELSMKVDKEDSETLLNEIGMLEEASDVLDLIGDIGTVIEKANDLGDLIDKISQLCAIHDLTKGYSEVMRFMCDACDSDNIALKSALAYMRDVTSGALTEEMASAILTGQTVADDALKSVLGAVKKSVLSVMGYGGTVISFAQSLSKYVANQLFATDNIQSAFYKSRALYDIEDLLRLALKGTSSADRFFAAFSLYENVMYKGADYSVSYYKAVYEDSIFGRVFAWIQGNSDAASKFKSMMSDEKDRLKVSFDNLQRRAYNGYKGLAHTSEVGDLNVRQEYIIPDLSDLVENDAQLNKLSIETYGLPDEDYTLTEDMTLYANVYHSNGTIDLNGHSLTILGDLVLEDGCVKINGGQLNISGDYNAAIPVTNSDGTTGYNGGYLDMGNINDRVTVEGDFNTCIDSYGYLELGIIELKGNLNDYYCYGDGSYTHWGLRSGGTKFIFSGSGEQTVTASDGYICFENVDFQNPNITFIETEISCYIEKDETVNGDLYISEIDLKGHKLTVNGNLQLRNKITLNGGELYIAGDYNAAIPVTNSDGTTGYTGGYLYMRNVNDKVTVCGDFSTCYNYYTANSTYSDLTSGEIEIKGNLNDYCCSANGDSYGIYSYGTKFIFSGSGKQTITATDGYICFKNVEFANKDTTGSIEFDNTTISCHIEKDETVTGNLDISSMELKGHKLTVNGNLKLWNKLSLNGGELYITGDYNAYIPVKNADGTISYTGGYLYMRNVNDKVTVCGDFSTCYNYYTANSTYSDLTSGKIEIKGNLNDYCCSANSDSYGIYSYGTKFIFSGSSTQTITALDGALVLKTAEFVNKDVQIACSTDIDVDVPVKVHDYSDEWTVDVEAACNDGSKSHHCTRCDAKTDITVIPATGKHSFGDWKITKAATCTAEGTQTRTCSVCKKVETQTIEALGHTEVTDKAVAATCTKTGLTEGIHCSVCDAVIKAQEVIPAKGHTEVIDKAVAATCTKTGLTEGIHCSVCDAVIKAQETVPATGKHSFGNWKITKAATCTATGTKTRTCSVCGKVETQTIAKTAHKYVNTVVKPTYTAQGYTLHKCSVCGTSYKDTYTAKLTLAKVTGVKLGGRAADALRVNWTKNANASGYIVEMYQGNKWVRVAKITSNATTTYRASGLKASTVYKFRVRAYKMSGKTAVYSAYSTELAARTNPSVMTGAKLGGRAADALRINWTKNASADGYIVEMYQGNKWVRVAKITSNSTTTFRKAGLKASSVYKFRVMAYKMSGKTALYGNYSATVTARTNPSIVKGVKIGGKAKDALRVNWTKNSSAQGYIVEMYKGGKWVRVAKITNGNTTTFRKAGLAKNTTYKFRVKAYYMSGKTALYGNYGSVSGKTAAK